MNIPAIGIGPLGAGEWSVGGLGTSVPSPTQGSTGSGSGSFGNALDSAIGSLNTTQTNADQASQELATGTISDPTKAVTAVENASLAMDYASQLRNTIVTDATTIFQTQM